MALHGLYALLVLLLTVLPTCRAASGTTVPPGTIFPLYTPPTDASWTAVANGKKNHPTVTVMAAINPSNGPGSSKNAAYDTGINSLAKPGVQVLGYVSTRYGARAASDVQKDIANYKAFYTGLSGIFLSEMANKTGQEQYYKALTTYAKNIQGIMTVVGDPGTAIPSSYVGTVDIINIYEGASLPTSNFLAAYPGKSSLANWCIMCYQQSTLDSQFVSSAIQHVGYVYVTQSASSMPAVASYFDSLLGALAKSTST